MAKKSKPESAETQDAEQPTTSVVGSPTDEVKLGITAEVRPNLEVVKAYEPTDEELVKAMVDAAVGDNRSQFRMIGCTERAHELLAMLKAFHAAHSR